MEIKWKWNKVEMKWKWDGMAEMITLGHRRVDFWISDWISADSVRDFFCGRPPVQSSWLSAWSVCVWRSKIGGAKAPLPPPSSQFRHPWIVEYHRSGNFHCKKIFVVCVNPENKKIKKHKILFTTDNHYSQHIFVHTVSVVDLEI